MRGDDGACGGDDGLGRVGTGVPGDQPGSARSRPPRLRRDRRPSEPGTLRRTCLGGLGQLDCEVVSRLDTDRTYPPEAILRFTCGREWAETSPLSYGGDGLKRMEVDLGGPTLIGSISQNRASPSTRGPFAAPQSGNLQLSLDANFSGPRPETAPVESAGEADQWHLVSMIHDAV